MEASGIKLNTESLVSILVGGIAFDTFKNSPGPEEQARKVQFQTFPEPRIGQEKVYSEKNYFTLLFDESVRGLSIGAPVEFRGIQMGK